MADLYDDFNFKVKWDGKYVAGISRVSSLVRSTETVMHGDGGGSIPEKSPGRTTYEAITLERGRTSDTAFEEWANLVPGAPVTPATLVGTAFRKDVILDVYNEAGQKVMSFNIFQCWPSRYLALPTLNANDHGAAVEQLTLEHEGWERDLQVVAPVNS